MKKLLIVMISVIMVLSMAACGGSGNKGNDNPYNLDMKSTEVQPMSEERASIDVLRETFYTYLGGLNYFEGSEQEKLTYSDVKDHIGVDPSEYRYDENYEAELYTWYADGDDNVILSIWFKDGKIYACGAFNI